MISKVLLKCVSKEDKKVFKTFTIRNINPSVIKTCLSLKSLIKAQLGEDILKDFDIGYLHGNSVVNVRNSDDLQEYLQTDSQYLDVGQENEGSEDLDERSANVPGVAMAVYTYLERSPHPHH